jgi:hypothetical protein
LQVRFARFKEKITMKHLRSVAVVFLTTIVAAICPRPAAAQAIGIISETLDGQQTNVWCWAASGEMAMSYFGVNVQQCTEATYQFGTSAGVDCCKNPVPGACVSGGQVVINHYGFTYQQLGGSSALSPTQIRNQISTRKEPWIFNPYCANSSQCGNWGHVLTGVGYFAPFVPPTIALPDFFFLFVNDPWPPHVGSFYLQFYPAYKDGCWWGNGSCNGYAEGWDIYNIVPPKLIPPKFTGLEVNERIPPEELQAVMQGDPDPEKVAQLSWRLVTPAISEATATTLGFNSAAEARDARITRPVEQFDVSLPRLQSFTPQANAEALLEHAPSVLVPVEAGGHIRASIRLHQQGKQWRLLAIGNPQFSAAWERERAAGGQFIVFVEGLELAFAGKRANGKVTMVSLFNVPLYGLKQGEELPAEKALGSLVKAAQEYHGNGATAQTLRRSLDQTR